MKLIDKALNFHGRLRRRDFWLTLIIIYGIMLIAMAINLAVALPSLRSDIPSPAEIVVFVLVCVLWLVLIAPTLAAGVKRCHDRNKSGWWLLLTMVPVIGFLWWVIDLGLTEGTPGPNKYGRSPKDPGEAPRTGGLVT